MFLTIYGLVTASECGWSAVSITMLTGSTLRFVVVGVRQRTSPDPLLKVSLFLQTEVGWLWTLVPAP